MTKHIEFNEIQVGDKVRATHTHPSGDVSIMVGVVKQKQGGLLQTYNFLFSERDADGWKYELLERPLDSKQVELAKKFLSDNFNYTPESAKNIADAQRFVRGGVIFPEA